MLLLLWEIKLGLKNKNYNCLANKFNSLRILLRLQLEKKLIFQKFLKNSNYNLLDLISLKKLKNNKMKRVVNFWRLTLIKLKNCVRKMMNWHNNYSWINSPKEVFTLLFWLMTALQWQVKSLEILNRLLQVW